MSKQIILSIDFDNTIAENAFPLIGVPKRNVSEVMQKLVEEGFYIIIWTCRQGLDIDRIKSWCNNHRVPYHKINEHHPTLLETFGNDTRKIAADIYIDDKCLMGIPNDWIDIYQLIKLKSNDLQDKILNYGQ